MNYRKLILVIALCEVAFGAHAQSAKGSSQPSKKPPSWQEIARWPDLTTGMWQEKMHLEPGGGGFAPMAMPKLTAKAQAILDEKRKQVTAPGGESCKPPGMPGMVLQGYSLGFYYAQNAVFMMTDMDNLWLRRIFTDRSTHGDPDPSWQGHSIGHWEGDTLIIDTVAILPEAELAGVPSNGSTHIVERLRLTEPNTLQYKITVTNPDVFTTPWEMTKTFNRRKDWEIQDAWCGEDNRSSVDEKGNVRLDLTPPK